MFSKELSDWATMDNDLPNGVTREQHCPSHINLDNCSAISFSFKLEGEARGQAVISRTSTIEFKPVDKDRVRDVRPGDRVIIEGVERVIDLVEVFR